MAFWDIASAVAHTLQGQFIGQAHNGAQNDEIKKGAKKSILQETTTSDDSSKQLFIPTQEDKDLIQQLFDQQLANSHPSPTDKKLLKDGNTLVTPPPKGLQASTTKHPNPQYFIDETQTPMQISAPTKTPQNALKSLALEDLGNKKLNNDIKTQGHNMPLSDLSNISSFKTPCLGNEEAHNVCSLEDLTQHQQNSTLNTLNLKGIFQNSMNSALSQTAASQKPQSLIKPNENGLFTASTTDIKKINDLFALETIPPSEIPQPNHDPSTAQEIVQPLIKPDENGLFIASTKDTQKVKDLFALETIPPSEIPQPNHDPSTAQKIVQPLIKPDENGFFIASTEDTQKINDLFALDTIPPSEIPQPNYDPSTALSSSTPQEIVQPLIKPDENGLFIASTEDTQRVKDLFELDIKSPNENNDLITPEESQSVSIFSNHSTPSPKDVENIKNLMEQQESPIYFYFKNMISHPTQWIAENKALTTTAGLALIAGGIYLAKKYLSQPNNNIPKENSKITKSSSNIPHIYHKNSADYVMFEENKSNLEELIEKSKTAIKETYPKYITLFENDFEKKKNLIERLEQTKEGLSTLVQIYTEIHSNEDLNRNLYIWFILQNRDKLNHELMRIKSLNDASLASIDHTSQLSEDTEFESSPYELTMIGTPILSKKESDPQEDEGFEEI